jgi:hypothetical protein
MLTPVPFGSVTWSEGMKTVTRVVITLVVLASIRLVVAAPFRWF